ncbi:MAG: 16S rRNA (cytidine(1402)-2'-O)-methyltransferase [Chloroflexota bacterium]
MATRVATGRLYVVPTPIGNLDDITVRALRVLSEATLVLSEDTRHTRTLLSRHGIKARLLSYHQHNKLSRIDQVLEILAQGDVALVSNAGTPSISDPGFELIRAAIVAGIEIDVLPGASAVITAVVAAALPASGFLFAGFLPRSAKARRERLASLAETPYSLVFFEAPHRLTQTLQDALLVLGDREAVIARELTKLHQEIRRERLSDLVAHYAESEIRGEVTLVIAGAGEISSDSLSEALADLRRRKSQGEDRHSAMAAVRQEHGAPRNALYRAWLDAPDPDV